MPYKTQYRMQIVKITERRNGRVFSTRILDNVWVDDADMGSGLEIAKIWGGDFLASMPTSTPYDQCTRTIQAV